MIFEERELDSQGQIMTLGEIVIRRQYVYILVAYSRSELLSCSTPCQLSLYNQFFVSLVFCIASSIANSLHR